MSQYNRRSTCPACNCQNAASHRFCSQCGTPLPVNHAPQVVPTAISPTDALEQGDSFAKAVAYINRIVTQNSGREQHSFDYDAIRKQCNINGSLSRSFLQRLIQHYQATGWKAWLYENQHDISGVAEDPAFVLDHPDKPKR